MTITKKPVPTVTKGQGTPMIATTDVDAIINRGGSVVAESRATPTKSKRKPILIKLDIAVLNQIETAARRRKVKTTRQTWIEEAVIEKLARDSRPDN